MSSVSRGVCRSQVTKICSAVEEYLVSETIEKTKQELHVFNSRLKNAHQKLMAADRAFESLIAAEDLQRECELMVEYDDKAVSTIAKIENALQELNITPNDPVVQNNVSNVSSRVEINRVKLKPIELKKFDGNFENWLPFWEQFTSAVHENQEIDFISKFNYLSTCLVGKAAATITGFLPSERCYNDAINLLKDEFGNYDKIIERYVQKLLNIKPLQSQRDISGLRALYNETRSTMRSLSALNVNSSRYDIMTHSILLQAIPPKLRVEYHKQKKRSQININEDASCNNNSYETDTNYLLKFVQIEVESLENSLLSDNQEKKDNKSANSTEYKNKSKFNGSAVGLYTANQNEQKQCIICKGTNHKTHLCTSNMPVEQKKLILKKEGRCFRCANKNHTAKFCKAQWMKCQNCNGRHITALCGNKESKNDQKSEKNVSTTLSAVELEQAGIYLQTVKVIVCGDQTNVLSRCVLDNGSQRSYVCEKLVEKLNLPVIGYERSRIIAFGDNNKNKKLKNLKRVQLNLKSQYSNSQFIINATVVPNICSDVLPVPVIKNDQYNYLNDKLADKIACNEMTIDGMNILIGQDYIWKLSKNKNNIIGEKLVATETEFGWTIQGCHKATEDGSFVFNIIEQEEFDIANFWNLESVGIKLNNNCETVPTSINFEQNRYVVGLPWRNIETPLNSNYKIAKSRLCALTQKLLKNKKLNEYHEGMLDMFKNDVAEIVPNGSSNSKLYYMPHRPVYREEHTTTKMRIVFDASSNEPECLSLNEHLYAGKEFCADLITILLNFRSKTIAVCADIEKAFLQIVVNENDRDAQRFLWFNSMPKNNDVMPDMIECRMKRVTFGITSSPYLLASTIKKHLLLNEAQYPDVCKKLQHSFYVDDLVTSVDNIDDAFKLYKTSKKIMRSAGFNLRKWKSNSAELNSVFIEQKEDDVNNNQKVLGLIWNLNHDTITVNLKETVEYIQSLSSTKRGVLRAMGRIYDPLGFLGPFTVRIKMLLQSIWKKAVDWDEDLPDELDKIFKNWRAELELMLQFSVPRRITGELNSKRQLHLFADASPQAYGVVAYLREVTQENKIQVALICSKNRISPITKASQNELTLPKLELTAALMAARLSKFLLDNMNMKFDDVYLWTDSSITLYWIIGNKAKKNIHNYVRARVNEINKLTNIYDWRHCSGTENPADMLTRGMKGELFVKSNIWKNGPDWLKNEVDKFPSNKVELCMNIADETVDIEANLEPISDISNYSSIRRLLRVTAYVLKFISCMQTKCGINPIFKIDENSLDIQITITELKAAEIYWIKQEQNTYFKNEIATLRHNRSVLKVSKILSLNPILIDGILRVNSRLNSNCFSAEHKFPIILPKQSILSRLLIVEAHTSLLHGGINNVLAHLRRKYWIVQGRQLIKTVINKCVICKRLHGKNANEPWTMLPIERVNTSRPFENVGVDFAGPLFVKENNLNLKKVYIFLFTCAAVRAVHLELVMDMSVTSCINGIKRFIARRGIPNTVMSDNAKTFKRANLEINKLKNLMNHQAMLNQLTEMKISWKFIPERAAWWGGFWERLVKNVKTCLKSAIGKRTLNLDELYTLLAEVEGVINSRPLTYVSNDAADLEPLTPAHFLTFKSTINFDINFHIDHSQLSKIWVERQEILKRFIKRWRIEYLQQLRSIHFNKCGPIRSIKEGDVVILEDTNKPRLYWKLALVSKTYPGRDGRVRACDLHLGAGKYVKRPIKLLYPLEVSSALVGGRM